MGFADYLSRNPSGKLIPESVDDKKFVKIPIHEIKHAWLKHVIEPTNSVKSTGHYNHLLERKQTEQNDVTHNKQRSAVKSTLFALTHSRISCFSLLKI